VRTAAAGAPGETAPTAAPSLAVTATSRKAERRQLSLGFSEVLEDLGHTMLRAEVDILARGHWTAGVAGTAWTSDLTRGTHDSGFTGWQAAALVDAAYSRERGAWGFRADAAFGYGYGRYQVMDGFGNQFENTGESWLAETGLAVTRHVVGAWSIAAGPRVSWDLSYGGHVSFLGAAVRHTL
jgi:hypothetical protein